MYVFNKLWKTDFLNDSLVSGRETRWLRRERSVKPGVCLGYHSLYDTGGCVCSLRRVLLGGMAFWIHGCFFSSSLWLHDYMPEVKVLRTIYCFYHDKSSWRSLKFGVVLTGGPQDVSVGPHSTGTPQWIAPGPCWEGAVSNFSPALCFIPVARLKFMLSRLFCCPFRMRNIIVTSASLTPVFVDDIWS